MAPKNGFAKKPQVIPPFLAGNDGFAKRGDEEGPFNGGEEPFCESEPVDFFAKPFLDAMNTLQAYTVFRKTVLARHFERNFPAPFRKTVFRRHG